MRYTLPNSDRKVNIPDSEIENNMKVLGVTKEEAIEIWLEDNEYVENEEQNELDTKASAVKIQHGASAEKVEKTPRKPRNVKISSEKEQIFADLLNFLSEKYDISVLKDNKLIEIALGDKKFKLDLIETGKKKAKNS